MGFYTQEISIEEARYVRIGNGYLGDLNRKEGVNENTG